MTFITTGTSCSKSTRTAPRALAKYRINPGNVNIGKKHDDNFRTMIEIATANDKPVRIGGQLGLARSSVADALDG